MDLMNHPNFYQMQCIHNTFVFCFYNYENNFAVRYGRNVQ